ncbi:MAG: AbiH family protein [Eubacteriales bacterium]
MRGWKKRKEYTVTFMIGNGFDLNLGLPTSYREFYAYYTSPENCQDDSLIVQNLKSNITENLTNWSDLETAMGEFSRELSDFEECNLCFKDITLNLEHYLHEKCNLPEKTDISRVREISKGLPTEISEAFRVNRYFHSMIDHANRQQHYTNIGVINFNFTDHVNNLVCSYFDQFDHKFLGKKPKSIKSYSIRIGNDRYHTQIHGKMNRSPIIGVDNVSQLAIYREGRISREEAELFTKMKLNVHADRYWNTNFCMEQLRKSDIIFIYGMSIGETDKIWWDTVIKCLQTPKVNLVIDDFCPDDVYSMYGSRQCYEDAQFQKYRLDHRKEILKRLSPENNLSESVTKRIHIIPNSDIFSYMPYYLQGRLPKKNEKV